MGETKNAREVGNGLQKRKNAVGKDKRKTRTEKRIDVTQRNRTEGRRRRKCAREAD